MTPGFWNGRAVLVTGHTGFKGGWLCLWLKALGARVSGVALEPPTSPSLYETSGLAREIASLRGDVRDPDTLNTVFHEQRPEVVFHMAAQSLVRESYRRPVETFDTNVIGTVHCLEAARRAPSVRAVVVVTTDKCYTNRGKREGYRETDELGGADPYSASKAAAELATHAYRLSFFEDPAAALIASARAGNVVGGGDWAAERLVPDAMCSFAAAQPLNIRNPAATRPWQHVLEPLRGYLMLAEHLHAGERNAAAAWNFGPDPQDTKPVAWVAEQLAKRWGEGARWKSADSERLHEAAELALDSAKARAGLGWRPVLALEAALDWVVDWYKAFSHGANARTLTLEQISRYQAICAQ